MQGERKFDLNALYLSLCNLNFLGVGYLLAGLKKRWLIALGGNLTLLVAGYFLNASRQPILWAAVFAAVYIAMAVDLWFLIKKESSLIPEKLTGKSFILPLISAALIMVFLSGFFAYRYGGNTLITRGEAAYEEDDFQLAFKNLYSVNQLYRLSLNPAVSASEPRLNEVSVIVTAQDYASQNEYEQALEAVEKFHEFFPDSPKISLMNDLAIDQNLAWASDFQAEANYQACLDHFETILADYPDEADKRQNEIDEAMADNYLEWGTSLSEAKDYAASVEKLETVINSYIDTASYEDAYQAAGQAHYDLAMQLKSSDNFSSAVAHLLTVQNNYIDAVVLEKAVGEMPEILLGWGADLRDNQSFLAAMEKFAQVAEYTSDSQLLEQAENENLKTIALLAEDDGEDGAAVISQVFNQVCDGTAVDNPAVDIFPEEPGKALSCNVYGFVGVPDEVKADIPGTFRYVVTNEDADRRVQSCDYVTSYDRRVLERWQYGTKVSILYVKDGKTFKEKTFYGASPESCPREYRFSSKTETTWGEQVDDTKIEEWLATVIK